MSHAHHVRLLRVFISSPSDVAEERRLAREVVSRLNQLSSVRGRFILEACAYEWTVPPLVGHGEVPQLVVDEYLLRADEAAFFVGILRSRIGTPFRHPQTGVAYQSGTEYEFLRAYESNRSTGSPRILLYRGPAASDADREQADAVARFFQQFTGEAAEYRGLIQPYETPYDFSVRLFHDLEQVLARTYGGNAFTRAPEAPRGNVPVYDTPFVGRQAQRRDLLRYVEQGRGLIVLRGGGGIGKTRLACEAARDLAATGRFPGGCHYVEFKDRVSADRVAFAVQFALGRTPPPDQYVAPAEAVGRLLADLPPTLLVLNNLEPVEGLARDTVGAWRQSAPHVTLLVTSRTPLARVGGAQELRLTGLEYPHLPDRAPGWVGRLAANEAVRLFLETARFVQPDFDLTEENAADVEELCRSLQGQPHPIILVARRMRHSTPADLADDLRGRLHQIEDGGDALWETIAWSYARLPEGQQQVFRQACLFHDGFSREAADRVIRAEGLAGPRLLDAIRQLCDASLLESTAEGRTTRYWMYRTVQDFGRSLAPHDDAPGAPAARRWAEYFVSFAEDLGARTHTPEGPDALNRLFRDRDNLLVAHHWTLAAGEPVQAARLILGCSRALAARAPWQLRRDRVVESLEALGGRDPARRVRLLLELADTWWGVGDYEQARAVAGQAVEEAAGLDEALRALAFSYRGLACEHLGRWAEAMADYATGLRLADQAGDVRAQVRNLDGLAYLHDRQVHRDEALQTSERALRLARQSGDEFLLARAVNVRGLVLWHFGQPEAALGAFQEAEQLERRFGNLRLVGGRLTNQGLALTDLDRLPEALARFAEADLLHADQGNRAWRAVNAAGWGLALLLDQRPAEATALLSRFLPEAEATHYMENVALIAGNLGRSLLALGRPAEAEAQAVRALAIQRESGSRHRRYWGNLVLRARALSLLGRPEEARPVVREATELAADLGVRPDDPVRLVREDEQHLRELAAGLATEVS